MECSTAQDGYLCKEGRVKSVELLGRTWFIPKETKADEYTQIKKERRKTE